MKNEEIKKNLDILYKRIEEDTKKIKEIRDKCKHQKTHQGNCSWAPGHFFKGEICDYCDDIIKTEIEEKMEWKLTTSSTDSDSGDDYILAETKNWIADDIKSKR